MIVRPQDHTKYRRAEVALAESTVENLLGLKRLLTAGVFCRRWGGVGRGLFSGTLMYPVRMCVLPMYKELENRSPKRFARPDDG